MSIIRSSGMLVALTIKHHVWWLFYSEGHGNPTNWDPTIPALGTIPILTHPKEKTS